jgi:vesicle coat complex subunit
MVTNQMRSDLMSEDKFVIGLTLNAFCEVATPDMCLNLHKNICSMMGHQEPMVGKKAALAAIRVVTKCGNLVEEILPYAL